MSSPTPIPTLEQFLRGPIAMVQSVAPETVVYGPGGTRRQAALSGISPESDGYADWTRQRMAESIEALAQIGVRHIIMNLLRPAQMAEVGRYRERLLAWLADGLAGDAALGEWQRRGWRVRLLGGAEIPELRQAAERLAAVASTDGAPTVWWYVCPSERTPWDSLLAAVRDGHAGSQAEAIRYLYGEDIPPATLYLAFGKPIVSYDIIPPLLAGELQCYWTQQPGFRIDEETLRHILYDYAYLRRTWKQDKIERYTAISQQRDLWAQRRVLGLGRRLGPFWYPLEGSGEEGV